MRIPAVRTDIRSILSSPRCASPQLRFPCSELFDKPKSLKPFVVIRE